MSCCSTSIIYGYGIDVSDIKIQNILNFLIKHQDSLIKMNTNSEQWQQCAKTAIKQIETKINIPSIKTVDDLPDDAYNALEELSENDLEYYLLRDIVATIISKELELPNLEFQIGQADECPGGPSILLQETIPWHYSDKEKNLTENSFKNIFKPYVEELGYKESDIDYLTIEYFG